MKFTDLITRINAKPGLLVRNGLTSKLAIILKKWILNLVVYVCCKPALRQFLIISMSRLKLTRRARVIYSKLKGSVNINNLSGQDLFGVSIDNLSPRGRRIYSAIERTINDKVDN